MSLSLGFLKWRSPCAPDGVGVKDGFPSRSSTSGESPLSCFLSVGYGFGSIHLRSCFYPLGMKGDQRDQKAAEVGGSSSGQGLSMLTSHVCLSLAAWASSLQRSLQVNNLSQRLAVLGCPSPPDHGASAVIKPRLCSLPAPPSRRESNEGWLY